MEATDQKVAELLLEEKLVSSEQLHHLLTQKELLGGKLHELVIEMGYAQEARVTSALAAKFNAPRLKLDELPPDAGALSLLDAVTCEQHTVFPVALRNQGRILWIAVSDPLDEQVAEAVRAHTKVEQIKLGVAGPREIRRAIMLHYGNVAFLGPPAPKTLEIQLDLSDVDEAAGPAEDEDNTVMSSMEEMAEKAAERAAAQEPPLAPSATLQEILTLLQQLAVGHEQVLGTIRALVDLCVEKGVFSEEELQRRLER